MNTPSDMRNNGSLSAGEAYRLGWTFLWPVVLLNFAFWQLEGMFEVSEWAAIAMQAANVVLAVFVWLPKAISRTVQSEFPRFHLAIRRPETDDLSRSVDYRESLRLSVRVAIWTCGLAALPLAWVRSLLTAGQNPGQIIINSVPVIALLSLPVWAAWVLLLDVSKPFSLRIVRTDAIEAPEA
jgi:hypothetical protein